MNHLGVFAKYWEPGTVKTRLARDVGCAAAANLFREFVRETTRRFAAAGDHRSLWITPPGREHEFQELCGPGWAIHRQADGNLGDRMRCFFRYQLVRHRYVVLTGSDVPDLPLRRIADAFDKLESHDVVLGPGTDGGYWLVGMRNRPGRIFDGIDWGTHRVLDQTRQRLDEEGRRFAELASWSDVDRLDDLHALRERVTRPPVDPDSPLVSAIDQALGGLRPPGTQQITEPA